MGVPDVDSTATGSKTVSRLPSHKTLLSSFRVPGSKPAVMRLNTKQRLRAPTTASHLLEVVSLPEDSDDEDKLSDLAKDHEDQERADSPNSPELETMAKEKTELETALKEKKTLHTFDAVFENAVETNGRFTPSIRPSPSSSSTLSSSIKQGQPTRTYSRFRQTGATRQSRRNISNSDTTTSNSTPSGATALALVAWVRAQTSLLQRPPWWRRGFFRSKRISHAPSSDSGTADVTRSSTPAPQARTIRFITRLTLPIHSTASLPLLVQSHSLNDDQNNAGQSQSLSKSLDDSDASSGDAAQRSLDGAAEQMQRKDIVDDDSFEKLDKIFGMLSRSLSDESQSFEWEIPLEIEDDDDGEDAVLLAAFDSENDETRWQTRPWMVAARALIRRPEWTSDKVALLSDVGDSADRFLGYNVDCVEATSSANDIALLVLGQQAWEAEQCFLTDFQGTLPRLHVKDDKISSICPEAAILGDTRFSEDSISDREGNGAPVWSEELQRRLAIQKAYQLRLSYGGRQTRRVARENPHGDLWTVDELPSEDERSEGVFERSEGVISMSC